MSLKRLEPEDIVISADSVTCPAWANNLVTLTASGMVTSSTQAQSTSGDYYTQVWNGDPALDSSTIQFNISYADKAGSGSLLIDQALPSGSSPTRTIYKQFRNLILGDEEANILFGGVEAPRFYVINLERARYKEKLVPGTFELTLSGSAGSLTLIDSSPYISAETFSDAGREYDLYRKAGNNYTASYGNLGSWGKMYPDIGTVLLNAAMLEQTADGAGIGLLTASGSNSDDENALTLYEAFKLGNSFKLAAEETITSNYIFVNLKANEYNYSTNPSLITGSGDIRHSVMIDSPEAFITTVGFYNDQNDLLAVAKMSRPLVKSFTKGALVRAKFDF